jgi:hypothetical protein
MIKSGRPPTTSANIHATSLYIYDAENQLQLKKGVADGATL